MLNNSYRNIDVICPEVWPNLSAATYLATNFLHPFLCSDFLRASPNSCLSVRWGLPIFFFAFLSFFLFELYLGKLLSVTCSHNTFSFSTLWLKDHKVQVLPLFYRSPPVCDALEPSKASHLSGLHPPL